VGDYALLGRLTRIGGLEIQLEERQEIRMNSRASLKIWKEVVEPPSRAREDKYFQYRKLAVFRSTPDRQLGVFGMFTVKL
jgi:hypothetical protein